MMLSSSRLIFCLISEAVDRFWAALWWTRVRIWLSGKRLEDALEQFDQDPMAVRSLTEKDRRLVRSYRFWRTADPLIETVLEQCDKEGVPLEDLQLLSLNRDIQRVGDRIVIRRGWGYSVIAYLAAGVTFINWLFVFVLVLVSPIDWLTKACCLLVVSGIYCFFWSGLALYTTRPLAAIKRSGKAIEAIATRSRLSSGQVVVFPRA